MRILITGSTGLLGGEFLNFLSQKKDLEIYALSRKKQNNEINDIKWIQFDFLNPLISEEFPDQIDVVYHFAQSNDYRNFPDKSMDIFSVNIHGTQFLLDYSRKAGAKHFIYTSTGSVYENLEGICDEDTHCKPSSYYATTKLCSENIVLCYSKYFKTSIFRLFSLYGTTFYGRFLGHIISSLKEGNSLFLSKDGSSSCFFPTHVRDLAESFFIMLKNDSEGIFNLCCPEMFSFEEIASLVGEILNISPKFEYQEIRPTKIAPSLEKVAKFVDINNFRSFKEEISEIH